MDCRPEEGYTGVLRVNLIVRGVKRQIYEGNKETVLANAENISLQVEKAYEDA